MKIGKLAISVIVLCGLMMSLVKGCLFERDDFDYIEESGQITITGYWGYETNVTIPSTINGKIVRRIGDSAFRAAGISTRTITIPDSVTSIGDFAFNGLEHLTSITIPGNVTSIGQGAFTRCDSLTSIMIPDSVTSIGEQAFGFCNALIEINTSSGNPNYTSEAGILYSKDKKTIFACPAGNSGAFEIYSEVTYIGAGAFSGCASLTSITIPDSVTSIAEYAFSFCESLTSITIPDGLTSIAEYAFSNCESLTSITLPDGLISIGAAAFEQCVNLTSITIPYTVSSVGYSAFSSCRELTEIIVSPGNPEYSSDAGILYNEDKTTVIFCPPGKSGVVVLPDGVINIEGHAFYRCDKLTEITLPDGVTSIGQWAFFECTSLTNITIPESVTSLVTSVFSHCFELTDISVSSGNPQYSSEAGILYNKEKTTVICCPPGKSGAVVLPDGVINIDNSAFDRCEKLTKITLPNGVTSIGWGAFKGCVTLASITIPDSVTSIDENIFDDCDLVVIHCSEDSYAHSYAKENEIEYVLEG